MIIDGEEFRYLVGGKEFHCPVDVTMNYIGGKWKSVVLFYLGQQPLRFGELKEKIPQITEKMLSLQLKALAKDDFVERTVVPDTPPKVVYSLTKDGESLMNLVSEMERWGEQIVSKRGKLKQI